MGTTFEDYDAAVRAFWQGRDLQTQKQVESGKIDAGTRGSVTGGKHLTAIHDVLADQFEPLLEMGAEVRRSGHIPIPGFYRQTKNWDVAVVYRGSLVAAIECKSMVGSIGKNFNNRVEEAIGNAVDLWRAYEAGLIGDMKPWLGFVFVFEHSSEATKSRRGAGKPVYPPDPIFKGASYTKRYQILFDRLVKERLYDAACLLSTAEGQGIHDEPIDLVSTKNLTASIAGRVEYVKGLA